MKRSILPAVALLLACGGDSSGPEGELPAELVGEWVAEPACAPPCAFTLTSIEPPVSQLEAVSVFGITVRMTLAGSGGFTLSGTSVQAQKGQARVEGGALIVRDGAGVEDTLDYSVQAGHLYLDFRREFDFNVDADAELERVRVSAVLKRR